MCKRCCKKKKKKDAKKGLKNAVNLTDVVNIGKTLKKEKVNLLHSLQKLKKCIHFLGPINRFVGSPILICLSIIVCVYHLGGNGFPSISNYLGMVHSKNLHQLCNVAISTHLTFQHSILE